MATRQHYFERRLDSARRMLSSHHQPREQVQEASWCSSPATYFGDSALAKMHYKYINWHLVARWRWPARRLIERRCAWSTSTITTSPPHNEER